MIEGGVILVTGGAGSVGRHIVRHLLSLDAETVRVFDNNESNLSELRRQLDDDRCRYLVGDIRNKDRLDRAFEDVDVVIHMAGIKHVDLSEYNPFEAVRTNVIGLQNVVDAALDADIHRLVFTSSDKAVNPANTMGTTKLLAEKLITAGNKYRGPRELNLASVRFGNIINSSQSVVPLFCRQISNGGPVTITDERMSRFFLTFDDVTDLVTSAVERTRGGEIFVRKMPAIAISDLADVLIEELAPMFGYAPGDIDREIIGARIGETIHEEIMTERQAIRAIENEKMYAILPETGSGSNGFLDHGGLDGFKEPESIARSSEDVETMDSDQIVTFLNETGALEGYR